MSGALVADAVAALHNQAAVEPRPLELNLALLDIGRPPLGLPGQALLVFGQRSLGRRGPPCNGAIAHSNCFERTGGQVALPAFQIDYCTKIA